MKMRKQFLVGLLLLITSSSFLQEGPYVLGQPSPADGIQTLIVLANQTPHTLIPSPIRPLLLAKEQEQFLQELEGSPPDWTTLHSSDPTKQSEHLFQLNRLRDEARLSQGTLLNKPIAFLWAGLLRQYLQEYQGFSVALGPELTHTSWGIIRFKPMDLPNYLVAIPSPELTTQLQGRQEQGEKIEIGILLMGALIPDESIIYGFSHDGQEDGMIMPVVSIQHILYFLKSS